MLEELKRKIHEPDFYIPCNYLNPVEFSKLPEEQYGGPLHVGGSTPLLH